MLESEFQEQIIELAHALRWTVAHFRPAKTAHGWRTPVSADGAGFPDLVLVRPPRLIVAELKNEKGRVSVDQRAWLDLFESVPCAETHLWRPDDFEAIHAALR